MQTLLTYVVYSDGDSEDTCYKLPRSVLALAGMESPLTAVFTGIFGVRSNSTLMPYLDKHLPLKKGQKICPVAVEIPVDLIATQYTGIEEGDVLIEDSNTLNTLRLRADLIHKIQGVWAESGAAEYGKTDAKFPYKPTAVPQYIDALKSPDNYPHLDLIVYQVASPAGTIAVASAYVKPVKVEPWVDLPGKIIY